MAEEFYTSDIDIAAYLRCKGIRYLRIQPSDRPNIADFVFAETPELFQGLVDWHQETDLHDFARKRRKLFVMARRVVEADGE